MADVTNDARVVEARAFPPCRACGRGELLPLSDFGPAGGEVRFKAWACTNAACGFNVRIHGGELARWAPVADGTAGSAAGTPTARSAPDAPAPPSAAPPRSATR